MMMEYFVTDCVITLLINIHSSAIVTLLLKLNVVIVSSPLVMHVVDIVN